VDLTSIVYGNIRIPYGMGRVLPKVWANRNTILRLLSQTECQADGRISALLKRQKTLASPAFKTGPLKSIVNASSKSAKAELKFYKPFQPNIEKVGKILKDNKKPKIRKVNGMPMLTFDKSYLYLKSCETG
jgi:hypothetical protein